jgi:hypothetical protein
MAAAPVGISNSQTERIAVYVYFQTDDQYHEPGTLEPLHRWNVGDIQATPYANFYDFITRFKAFLSGHGITDYLLNFGPIFEGQYTFMLENYGPPIPGSFNNKLFSLNLLNAEAEELGILDLGFVLWSNVVDPPKEQITYNPLEVNLQAGVHVDEDHEIFFQGAAVNEVFLPPPAAGAGAPGNQVGANVGGPPANQNALNVPNLIPLNNLEGGRRRRTFKKRRSFRKRASRRSS